MQSAGHAGCACKVRNPGFGSLFDTARVKARAKGLVSIDDVRAATAFLAHRASRLITGESAHVDGG